MKISKAYMRRTGLFGCMGLSIITGATLFAQQRAQAPAAGRAPARTAAPAARSATGGTTAANAAPLVRENATKKVSDHVWVIPDFNASLVPNVGIIVGNRATLVVDPGLGARNGQAVLREVAKISKNTEMYVTSTHFHAEHAGGVAAFPASAKYIVSQVQQKDLEELASAQAQRLASNRPAVANLLKEPTFRKPDITFEKQYEVDLGGLKVQLLSMGPTHTRGDLAVWVEDEGVLFAGDVVMNMTIVAFGEYSSTKAWMDALVQLARLRPKENENPAILVPSHGPIGNANLIAYQRGFFQGVQQRVKEYKEAGKPEAEIISSVTEEMKNRYSMWTANSRIEAIVKNVYAEMQ